MRNRCNRPDYPTYSRWGGRGIKVCKPWMSDFWQFVCDVGLPPTKDSTLDRIDNDGDYEPSNVRWTTQKVQSRNRRDNTKVSILGEDYCLSEAEEITGISQKSLSQRLRSGDSQEDALKPTGELIPRGENHSSAKLTDDAVRQIRMWYATARITSRKLAEFYGLTGPNIMAVVNRKSWKHVE